MSLISRFLNVFRSKALERDLDDELRFHLEQRAAANLGRGMTSPDAESAALQQFGEVTRAKNEMREVRMMNRHVLASFGVGVILGAVISSAVFLRFHTTTPLQPSVLYIVDPMYGNLVQADITAPVVVEERKPKYTSEALRAKKAGMVKMGCIVQTTGICTDVRVTRSLDPDGLDGEAIKAVQGWRFKPATRANMPVPYYVTIEMAFNCKGCTPAEYKPITWNY